MLYWFGLPKQNLFQSPLGEVVKETSVVNTLRQNPNNGAFQSPLGEVVKETDRGKRKAKDSRWFQSPLGEVVKETFRSK